MNEILPDYIGFVFAQSKRQVSKDIAKGLKNELSSSIKAVGVFVDAEINNIINLCDSGTIDMVQLHGNEGEDYIKELKKQVLVPIIKAVRIKNGEELRYVEELSCDYLLLDTYKENQYGGCGETFDWSKAINISKPFFVAGGLKSDNVLQAINQTMPHAVDVSSGVETEGSKDRDKIIEFITIVRSIDL